MVYMSKSHGMDSTKASRIKRRGHNKEHLFAALIGGEVIKGDKKEDVIDRYGKYYTIKGGSEMKGGDGNKGKWQLFLYRLSKFETDTSFYGRDIFIKILRCYPDYDNYLLHKDEIKMLIKPLMQELKDYLLINDNRRNFILKSCFNDRVNYFVVYHNDIFYIYDKEEIVDIFVNRFVVDVNSTFQKVVFKYNNITISEIEVRTTNDGKYPSILYNMLKHCVCNVLKNERLPYREHSKNIRIYGKAIATWNKC